ncbi:hypothetical protein D3C72_1990650 [compost metagenome]
MPALYYGFRQMAAVNAARQQMVGAYSSVRQFGTADTAVRQQIGSQCLLGQMLQGNAAAPDMAAIHRFRCNVACIYAAGCQLGRTNRAVCQLICTDAAVRQNFRAADFFGQMVQRNLAFADVPALHRGFRQMAAVNAARR